MPLTTQPPSHAPNGPPAAAEALHGVVQVPGIDVPLFRLDLPAGLRGLAREQVARRQVSDRLGLPPQDIEIRPFAPGATADAWTRVLVAAPAQLAQWRGLEGRAVIPDYLALPCAARVWTLRTQGSAVAVRLGPDDGFTARPDLLVAMLDLALADTAPAALFVPDGADPGIDRWAQVHGIPVARAASDLAALGLPRPEVLAHGELACDLRRDPQAARARLAARVLPWRWPLLAGALAAAVFAADQIVVARDAQADADRLRAQTARTVEAAFPGLGPLLDVRVQVARALDVRAAARTPDVNPVALGRRAAEIVASQGALPERLGWTATEGVILAVRLPDFAASEQLETALRAEGLQATLTESRVATDSAGVLAQFRILAEGGTR